MLVKQKSLRIAAAAVLLAIAVYAGISCAAALLKAIGQPYLLSGTVRYDFTGYYLIAAVCGAVSLLSAAGAILALRRRKTDGKKKK